MANITVLQNSSIDIDLQSDIADNGWSVSEGYAYHSSCNAGLIKNSSIPTVSGQEYTVVFDVLNISGEVYAILGGTEGISRTTTGRFTQNITAIDDSGLYFYGSGIVQIGLVRLSSGTVAPQTIAFNENANKWVTYLSYDPEMMAKFINSFFTFKGGQLWEHNVNEIRNNFYGQQFTSQIKFYCNLNPTEVKQFFSIREKSNKVWSVTDAYISPTEGKSQGQRTRLKKGRFRNLQGDWFADFLRNLEDPRFTTELEALLKGSEMQGGVMEISLENTDTVEVRLLSVDLLVAPKSYTY